MKAIAIIYCVSKSTLFVSLTGEGWTANLKWDYVKYPKRAYCRMIPKIEKLDKNEARAVVQVQAPMALKEALKGKKPSECILKPKVLHIIPQIAAVQAAEQDQEFVEENF